MSHLGPCYRPVLQMRGRGKWHTYRVKQHCSSTYASAKRTREIDACSLDSWNQFLYSSFGSEQHICVILHKYAAQGWVPFMGYCPTQSHFFVCACMWRLRPHCGFGTAEATLPLQGDKKCWWVQLTAPSSLLVPQTGGGVWQSKALSLDQPVFLSLSPPLPF